MILRAVEKSDLDTFFEQQRDADASAMAGVPMRDRFSFEERWDVVLTHPQIVIRTIDEDGAVAGYVFTFPMNDELRIGYWLGRAFWGRGVASAAVEAFLRLDERRPICATVSPENAASIRILERNGFEQTGSPGEHGLHFVLG